MLTITDKTEIFLNYLINTRQAISGEYYCVCRRSDGTRLDLRDGHKTQEAAIIKGQLAAIRETLEASAIPQFLVVTGEEGERIVTANEAAKIVFGGDISGWPYSSAAGGGLYALIKAGQTCSDFHGSKVVNQMVKMGRRTLMLVTISPA